MIDIAFPEIAPMRVVKRKLKVFNVSYLRSLNLIMAVGWSATTDIRSKYVLMLTYIEEHIELNEELNIYFKLEFFNKLSTKYFFKIIQRLNNANARGKKVKIYWNCNTKNQSEMIETGTTLEELCEFPFEVSYL